MLRASPVEWPRVWAFTLQKGELRRPHRLDSRFCFWSSIWWDREQCYRHKDRCSSTAREESCLTRVVGHQKKTLWEGKTGQQTSQQSGLHCKNNYFITCYVLFLIRWFQFKKKMVVSITVVTSCCPREDRIETSESLCASTLKIPMYFFTQEGCRSRPR